MNELVQAETIEIAVIGMACRVPGADNYRQFWQNLLDNKNSITEIPSDRFSWHKHYSDHKEHPKASVSKWGGFISDIANFDPLFFNMSPLEAQYVDPQQRLMLELAWECLEDASIAARNIKGKEVGVFCGAYRNDYQEYLDELRQPHAAHAATGMSNGIIANRISYFFDITGPSITVDAACASSIVAIDMAVKALINGDCQMAFAGGVNIICSPATYIKFSKMGMLSPTGQCKTFSEDADGYARGEGGGMLLLKPLAQAEADADRIHAIIKGVAVRHGGGKVRSLTRPCAQAQAEVITAAWQKAGVSLNDISFLEAHGTGTPIGDAIEIEGIKLAWQKLTSHFNASSSAEQICHIGSVKTNIGHLESAAGVIGVIKAILAMQQRKLPAINNFSKLNSRIDLQNMPFKITTELQQLQQNDNGTLYAGVSSFGFGGVNSHIVLANYGAPLLFSAINKASAKNHLCCFSAKSHASLQGYLRNFKNWLLENENLDIKDIAHTLACGREHLVKRIAIIAEGTHDLIAGIDSALCEPQNEIINTAVAVGDDLPDIAAAFIAGDDVEVMQALSNQGNKIALPTYFFNKIRCWVSSAEI